MQRASKFEMRGGEEEKPAQPASVVVLGQGADDTRKGQQMIRQTVAQTRERDGKGRRAGGEAGAAVLRTATAEAIGRRKGMNGNVRYNSTQEKDPRKEKPIKDSTRRMDKHSGKRRTTDVLGKARGSKNKSTRAAKRERERARARRLRCTHLSAKKKMGTPL